MDAVRPRLVEVLCTADMIWPSSLVCVTSTSGLINTSVRMVYFFLFSDWIDERSPLVGHGHHAYSALGIGIDLGLEHGRYCVCECAKAGGLIVAVSHVL